MTQADLLSLERLLIEFQLERQTEGAPAVLEQIRRHRKRIYPRRRCPWCDSRLDVNEKCPDSSCDMRKL